MAIEEQRGAGGETRRHVEGLSSVEPYEDKALPGGTVALGLGPQIAKNTLLELENVNDAVGSNPRLDCGGWIGEQDILELVWAGRQNGGSLVDLGGIEEVEDGEVLDREDFVHAFDAEAALAVEEIGDVGLLESG